MTEVDPIWQHNISKKIAQLTNVVFRLHADSIDNRDEVSKLREQYEIELSQIEAASKKHLAIAQKEADDYHPAIESTVRNEFETKYNQTKIQFEKARAKLESDSNRAIEAATARLSDLKGRVEALRLKAEQSAAVFNQANEEIQKLHQDTVARLDVRHKRELSKHIEDANAKYEALLASAAQREDELRMQFENELEELRKNLEQSKKATIDNLNRKQTEMENTISSLQKQKEDLKVMVENFAQQSTQQEREIEEMMRKAELMQKHIIESKKKELTDLQKSIDNAQNAHSAEIEKLKAEIAAEEAEHERQLKERQEKLEREKKRYQKLLDEFEAASKKSASESDQQNQLLANEHKANLEALEKQHAAYIEEARKKEMQSHDEMIEMQKKHYQELIRIRTEMEAELEKSRLTIEEMKKRHNAEILAIKTQQDKKMAECQEKLKTNSAESKATITKLLQEASDLKETLARSKEEHESAIAEIERKSSLDFSILQKTHEESMASLDREFDLKVKMLDLDHNAEVEKTKKQFILDSKRVEETGELNLKLEMELIKNEAELRRSNKLEQYKEEWAKECATLQQQIETKMQEKSSIEAQMKKDVAERQAKILSMKKEMEKMENEWKEEKQKLINDWNIKFENLQKQFTEEERQNEEARRMSVKDYTAKLEELKNELAQAEEEKVKELARIKAETEEEKKKGEAEIAKLEAQVAKLAAEHQPSIADLENQVKQLEDETTKKQHEIEDKRKTDVASLNEELNRLIREGRQQCNEASAELFKLKQEHQRKLHNMRYDLKQTELDVQYQVMEHERKRQAELEQLANEQRHEIEVLNIELSRIQRETDQLKHRHVEEIQRIQELHEKRLEQQKLEFEDQRTKLEDENKRILEEKQNIVNDLEASIKELEAKYQNRDARPEDIEYIQRLEELVQERQDSLDKIVTDFRSFENELLTHENLYHKVFSGEPPPMPLNPVADRRLKKEPSLKSCNSARKIPPLVAPVSTPRNHSPQ